MVRRMFDEISNPHRVAAVRPALEFMSRAGSNWNERYVATLEPGKAQELTMVGVQGEHFMARSTSAILVGQKADLPTPTPERNQEFRANPSAWPDVDDSARATNRREPSPGM